MKLVFVRGMRVVTRLGVSLVLAVLVIGWGGRPEVETCKQLLPESAINVAIASVGDKEYECSAEMGFVPITARIERELGEWTIQTATVDGESCLPFTWDIQKSYELSMTPDRKDCIKLMGQEMASIRDSSTPTGEKGCYGKLNEVPVVIEAIRTSRGWKTTRSWVQNDEIPVDQWKVEASRIGEQRDAEKVRNTAQRDRDMAEAKLQLLESMRDAAIERGRILHPMSEMTDVYSESESINEETSRELSLNCYYTLKFRGKVKNILTGKYKRSTVRIQVVGELYSRNNVPWDGHVESVSVLSDDSR